MRHALGFTLVEALVAVTLLALLFGALMPVFHNGLAVLQSGERHTRAVMIARSVLERHRVAVGLSSSATAQVGDEQGRFDDFRWQVTKTPFIEEVPREDNRTVPEAGTTVVTSADNALPVAFVLQQISVVVHWPGNETGVQLHTLVLAGEQ